MNVVRRATPGADGRSVRLSVEGLREGYCVHLRTDPTSVDGRAISSTEAWYTLNEIPRDPPPAPATLAGRPIDPDSHGVGVGVLPPAHAAPLITKSASNTMRYAGSDTPRSGR